MYTKSQIEYIKAITPVHAGTGQDLSIADMPIQREKHSNIPKIEASSLKGSIKSHLYHKFKKIDIDDKANKDLKKMYSIFGHEDGNEAASLIAFTDAKLLLFPIKSATDIFKLITCPYVLKRWAEDLKLIKDNQAEQKDENKDNYKWLNSLKVNDGQAIVLGKEKDKIILEDYVFKKDDHEIQKHKNNLDKLFKIIRNIDCNKIIVLSDSDFIELVTLHTEIITRNRININTGIAKDGGLFTEEYLPAESILYFVVLEGPNFSRDEEEKAIEYYTDNVGNIFQVGGNFTIGKGFVKRLSKESESNDNQKF